MRLNVTHVTKYQYDAQVPYALQQLRMTPKSRAGQTVVTWDVRVEGGRKELEFDDQHNNHVVLVSIEPDRPDITFVCEGVVETTDNAGVIGKHGGFTPVWLFTRPTDLTRPGTLTRNLAKTIGTGFDDDVQRLHALSHAIADRVRYETSRTDPETSAEDALQAGHGVCQDHAHIFVTAARYMGFPARYVSGYLMMNDRVDQDASHAWAEAHLDGIGWIGFDVSNGISPDGRYVRVATGLDYKDAAPVSGMRFGDSTENMTVSLQVQQ